VTELSIADMRDIYETRLILEDAAIRAATSRIDERQLERAARALPGMRASFLEGDERKAYAWHQDFHFALYEPAGSAWTLHLKDYDKPSSVAEQLRWLDAAGLRPRVAWAHRDLAVLVGEASS
jgi:DNA-binding GntR family transcriptional regulator